MNTGRRLRIVVAAQQAARRHPIPAYGFWTSFFREGLAEAGHCFLEVEGVDWAEGVALSDPAEQRAWRERTWARTVEEVERLRREGGVDLFLGYLFPNQVEPAAVDRIQSLGIPCVNFFCDNVREFTRVPDVYRCFDLHWVPETKAGAMYRSAGLPFIHAPMPVWVPPALRTSEHREVYRATFIGSRDIQREHLFARAIKLGGRIELRGPGWNGVDIPDTGAGEPASAGTWLRRQRECIGRDGIVVWGRKVSSRFRRRVADEVFRGHIRDNGWCDDYHGTLQQSMVALGVNRYPSFRHPFSRPDTYSRMRDIEAPMLGACYLTEWTEGLDELFDPGVEIETYRDAQEMVAKIEELSRAPQRRATLRREGQRRALAEHTIGRSIDRVVRALGLAA